MVGRGPSAGLRAHVLIAGVRPSVSVRTMDFTAFCLLLPDTTWTHGQVRGGEPRSAVECGSGKLAIRFRGANSGSASVKFTITSNH